MKTSSIQNILIAILIIANLILLGNGVYGAFRERKASEKYSESAKKVLSERGIELDEGVNIDQPKEYTVYDTVYDRDKTASVLLDCTPDEMTRFTLPSGESTLSYKEGSVLFRADGSFLFSTDRFVFDVYADMNFSEAEISKDTLKTADEYFKKISFACNTEYVGKADYDGAEILCYECFADKIKLDDGKFYLAVIDKKIVGATGKSLFSESTDEYKIEAVDEFRALFSLTDEKTECKIKNIDMVYRDILCKNGEYMLVPTYRISTPETYYDICAVSGIKLKRLEK